MYRMVTWAGVWAIAWCGVALGQEPRRQTEGADTPPARVTRAKRPQFRDRDWEGIYFENLFRDGLVGDKPDRPALTTPVPALADNTTTEESPTGGAASGSQWSQLISAEVLEDEIKRTVARLSGDVATPSKYQSDYLSARQSFSMLSLWFAVIFEYQDQVRWKPQAAAMQPAMARAAANARVSSGQSYQYARARLDALQQLLRGESPPAAETPVESIDWPYSVGRSPVMIRMQESLDELKAWTADAGAFRRNRAEVEHHAQLLAALGQALLQPEMDDADDDDYAKHARGLIQDALAMLQAARLDNVDDVDKSLKRVERRCSNCHADWR